MQMTMECLDSIVGCREVEINKVVVDNGSNDGSKDHFVKNGLDCICLPENVGYAKANNLGADYAIKKYNPDYLLLLNNDAYLVNGTIRELISATDEWDVIAPKIYYPQSNILWAAGGHINYWRSLAYNVGQGKRDDISFNKSRQIDFASGCALWIKTDVVKTIGLFDVRYKNYYEDVDFCSRAKRNGYSIGFIPEAVVYHWANVSSGDQYGKHQSYYRWRNRILFARLNCSLLQRVVFFCLVLPLIVIRDTILYAVKGKARNIIAAYMGAFDNDPVFSHDK